LVSLCRSVKNMTGSDSWTHIRVQSHKEHKLTKKQCELRCKNAVFTHVSLSRVFKHHGTLTVMAAQSSSECAEGVHDPVICHHTLVGTADLEMTTEPQVNGTKNHSWPATFSSNSWLQPLTLHLCDLHPGKETRVTNVRMVLKSVRFG
jgi:hypothetical protein